MSDGEDATNATINDIADNPKDIEFIEADLDLADALLVEEGEDSPYANFLAVRAEDEDNEALVALDELLRSDEVRSHIEQTWPDGEILPAF